MALGVILFILIVSYVGYLLMLNILNKHEKRANMMLGIEISIVGLAILTIGIFLSEQETSIFTLLAALIIVCMGFYIVLGSYSISVENVMESENQVKL